MEPELMTAGGKPRCVGRACGPAIKNMYPGAAVRYTEAQCKTACEEGSALCKTCKGYEAAFMVGENTKKKFHGSLGGPMTPYSHIVGSEWNLSTKAKDAAKAAATAMKDEAKAMKAAVNIFSEAESAAAAVAKAAEKERKDAAKGLREAEADAKKREAEAKRAGTAAAKAAKAATQMEKKAAVTEKRVSTFEDQLSGRLGWAQIGHRPYLPSALLPYSSSNGVKGYQARPGSARRTSSGARRTSSGARRNTRGRFTSSGSRRNTRGRFTSSSAAAPARRSSSMRRSNATRKAGAATAIQRGYRNFMNRSRKAAPMMPIVSAAAAPAPLAPKSSSNTASNLGGNMFGLENMGSNIPDLD